MKNLLLNRTPIKDSIVQELVEEFTADISVMDIGIARTTSSGRYTLYANIKVDELDTVRRTFGSSNSMLFDDFTDYFENRTYYDQVETEAEVAVLQTVLIAHKTEILRQCDLVNKVEKEVLQECVKCGDTDFDEVNRRKVCKLCGFWQ